MRLEYLFTISRKGKMGSRIIAHTTGKLCPHLKPCSHVAVKIGPLIVESTLKRGVQIRPFKRWIQDHKVVYAIQCPVDRRVVQVLDCLFDRFWDRGYDYSGIAYFAWRMLGFLIFKRPLPSKNRWHKENKYFCVEMIEAITGEKYHMTSPIQLLDKWLKSGLTKISPSKYNNMIE